MYLIHRTGRMSTRCGLPPRKLETQTPQLFSLLASEEIHSSTRVSREQEEVEEPEEPEAQAPAHRHELAGELSFTFGGHEYNQQNSLKTLRELCKELGVPKFGSKQEILRRLSRTIMKQKGTWSSAQPKRSTRSL